MIRRLFPARSPLVRALHATALVLGLALGCAGADGYHPDSDEGPVTTVCRDAEPGTQGCP